MRIQLTSRGGITTKEGKFKPYQEMDIEFIDLDGDRPKKKHLVSFNFKGFSKLAEAGIGSSWDVSTKTAKDPQYVDWIDAMPLAVETVVAPSKAVSNGSSERATAPFKSTYETPEERARRQVYIVRQSAINAAVAFLKDTPASAAGFHVTDVLNVAKQFEDYVFGKSAQEATQVIPTVE